jgi:hypothetical protein
MSLIPQLFRRLAPTTAAIAALATLPVGARAAWFGSNLSTNAPANSGSSCSHNDTIPPPMCTHVGSYYPGNTGRAKAPISGTVVTVQVRAEAAVSMRFELVKVRHLAPDFSSGRAQAVAISRVLSVRGPTTDQAYNGIYPTESFKVHLAVRKGEELAVLTARNRAEYCASGTPGQLTFYDPFLSPGQHFRASQGVDECLLLVRAQIRRP